MTSLQAPVADRPGGGSDAGVAGLLLAAGAGRRLGLGRPKALVTGGDGSSWLERSVEVLRAGGATPVYVVVGADAEAVQAAVPAWCLTVEAPDWHQGMGASLRSGLTAVTTGSPMAEAVMVMLVDTPGVSADVVRRLQGRAAPDVVARAAYAGVPGHPVLLGRKHWPGVLDTAAGDQGARGYLRSVEVELVECADLGSGADIDTAEALGEWLRMGNPD